MTALEQMGKNAKLAARKLAGAGALKDKALWAMAQAIEEKEAKIIVENARDIEAARNNGMKDSLLDRLTLNSARISEIAEGIRSIARQNDPIGRVVGGEVRPNGLKIEQIRVPLGVIGIIYEARPNVTADSAALCLKAGSAVILRGGKETIHSNICLADMMRTAVEQAGLPKDSIQLVEDISRSSSMEMMQMTEYIDVLIPRGGRGLIQSVVQNSHVPVIQTGSGNCHVYVEYDADIEMACNIIFNAKTSRPSVCNAIETVLVHKDIAEKLLPVMKARLDEKAVELRGCERTCAVLGDGVLAAEETDWSAEYLDYILAVKIVDNIDEAIEHIANYSSGHSEAIVTKSYLSAEKFTAEVDSAAVYVNASTRFTDGSQFGMGAEIGISTQKLHARGPMGVNELTSTKFIIHGSGQIR